MPVQTGQTEQLRVGSMIQVNMMNLSDLMAAENLFLDIQDGEPHDSVVEKLVDDPDLIVFFKQIVDDNRGRPKSSEAVEVADSVLALVWHILTEKVLAEGTELTKWANTGGPLDELRVGRQSTFRPRLIPADPSQGRALPPNPQRMYDAVARADTMSHGIYGSEGSSWQAFA